MTSVTMLRTSAFILIGAERRCSQFRTPGAAMSTTSIGDIGAVDSGDMTIMAGVSAGGGSSVPIGTSSTSRSIPTPIAMSRRAKHMVGGIGALNIRNTIHT